MHLITGKASEPHVTSLNQAVENALIHGRGRYVFKYVNEFSAYIVDGLKVRIFAGIGIMDGRMFEIEFGNFEDITIDKETEGRTRKDLIVARYTKDLETGIENVSLVVLKNTDSSPYRDSSPLNPETIIADMPLYTVKVNGSIIESIEKKFNVLPMGVKKEPFYAYASGQLTIPPKEHATYTILTPTDNIVGLLTKTEIYTIACDQGGLVINLDTSGRYLHVYNATDEEIHNVEIVVWITR